MARLLRLLLALIVLALGVVAGVLGWAHRGVRSVRPQVPSVSGLAIASAPAEDPVRLSYINTATQRMPRSAVLDSSRDPAPELPYAMSHPSFVLEWEDGRILLVDAGMTREGARAFGAPLEYVGAEAIQPLTSAAEALGASCRRVRAVVFTHLHDDHVGGIEEICRCADGKITVFMHAPQANAPNYTTRGARDLLDRLPCVEIAILGSGPIARLPRYPGVLLVHAGGHTPGSQVLVARVRGEQRYVFTGDLINNLDGAMHNVRKPFLYSLLVVPEDGAQLANWRHLLQRLAGSEHSLVVAHDQYAIEALNLPQFDSSP